MSGENSRKHEFGYRIASAFTSCGWAAELRPVQDIVNFKSLGVYDFAMVDSIIFAQALTDEQISDHLSNLKRYFKKVIIIEPDAWTGQHDNKLLIHSEIIDYIWGFTSDWPLLQRSEYKNRSILFPNVGGFENSTNYNTTTNKSCKHGFNFTGSVEGYNINRMYWMLNFIKHKMPVDIYITKPTIDDGLSRNESLLKYAQLLASTSCVINLSTRCDGSRIINGRTSEVFSINRLLIQEACPALRQYYVEGEHFLEFSEVDDLQTTVEFLRSHPQAGKTICTQGHQFYLERYSCRKMVEHIQTLL